MDCEGGNQGRTGLDAKHPHPGEDASEVVADGGENCVGGIAGLAVEIAAAEVAFGLHVADDDFDGGAASQFWFDDAEDAALLTGDEDTTRVWRIVAAIYLVDIDALDLAAREALRMLDGGSQGVSVVGISLACGMNWAAWRASIDDDDRDFDAELPGRAGLGAIELSHATLRKMRQNLWWAVGYKVITFPHAAGVLYPLLLGPSIAALVVSCSSALVAINALMLKRTKLTGLRRQSAPAR